jgi:hypothetical protein
MRIGDIIFCSIENKDYTVIQICYTTVLAKSKDGEVRQFDNL